MRVLLGFILSILTGVSPLAAQDLLHSFEGTGHDQFGVSVRGAGDVDADGFEDLIVGAWFDGTNGERSGSARVFSGRTGDVLHAFFGDEPRDWFGASVSGAGDVDGDGHADVIVGATRDGGPQGTGPGSATVFSGRTGSVIRVYYGDSVGDGFGGSVDCAGDVNQDGYPDLVAGAFLDDDNGPESGSVRVLSGRDGAVLHTFYGDDDGDMLGWSVAGAGDVDGDGHDDVIAGAARDDHNGTHSGSARVFSGRTGAVLYTFYGDAAGDGFGWSVSAAGDADGDGFADVIVGAPRNDTNGRESGLARLFTGQSGAVLHTFYGSLRGDLLGVSVRDAGDVDCDGCPDVVVGAKGSNAQAGSAIVYCARTGNVIHTFYGEAWGDAFGVSVSGAGDCNCDGFGDVVVGAYWAEVTEEKSGTAYVYSGLAAANPNPPLLKVYGHACPSADGRLPHIGRRGWPVIGRTFLLTLRTAPVRRSALLLLGPGRNALDLGPYGAPGCVYGTHPTTSVPVRTDAAGRAAVAVIIQNNPALLGVTLYAQWFIGDSVNRLGAITSDSVLFQIGRL